MFCKKGILKNLIHFTGKHLRWSHFLIKLHFWGSVFVLFFVLALFSHLILCSLSAICHKSNWNKSLIIITIMRLYQKRLRDICFPVKFAKFLRTAILKNICEQLLLNFISKETPAQMFSCEFCELYKNTYFEEHPRTAGSEIPARRCALQLVETFWLVETFL